MLLLLFGSLRTIHWSWHERRRLRSCLASKRSTLPSQRNNRCAGPVTRITTSDAEALVRSRSLPQKAEDTQFLCMQLQRGYTQSAARKIKRISQAAASPMDTCVLAQGRRRQSACLLSKLGTSTGRWEAACLQRRELFHAVVNSHPRTSSEVKCLRRE